MNGPFRKSVLQHRIALETIWPLAFPQHDYQTLRMIRSPTNPADYWEGESWKRAAHEYHRERRQLERRR